MQFKFSEIAGILAIGGIVLAAGCGSNGSSGERSASVRGGEREPVVLQVAASAYSGSDFRKYVQDAFGKGKLSNVSLSRLFDRFTEEKLLLEAARRQGLTLTRQEKNDYLAKIAAESPPEDAKTMTAESTDSPVFDRLLIEKYSYQFIKGIQVSDEEVHSFYEEHKKDYLLPERVKSSQVLLKSENKAVEVRRLLEGASEEAFRQMARKESTGPEAFKGGEMGTFKIGDLPYEMEKVIFALDEGRLSPVFESSYGFHIFRVDRKFPPQLLSEAEASPSIRIRVLDAKIKDALASHMDELKSSLIWTSYPSKLFFEYQRNDQ
jgi:parvulin-like peptidyl-prolyl isomerase